MLLVVCPSQGPLLCRSVAESIAPVSPPLPVSCCAEVSNLSVCTNTQCLAEAHSSFVTAGLSVCAPGCVSLSRSLCSVALSPNPLPPFHLPLPVSCCAEVSNLSVCTNTQCLAEAHSSFVTAGLSVCAPGCVSLCSVAKYVVPCQTKLTADLLWYLIWTGPLGWTLRICSCILKLAGS